LEPFSLPVSLPKMARNCGSRGVDCLHPVAPIGFSSSNTGVRCSVFCSVTLLGTCFAWELKEERSVLPEAGSGRALPLTTGDLQRATRLTERSTEHALKMLSREHGKLLLTRGPAC